MLQKTMVEKLECLMLCAAIVWTRQHVHAAPSFSLDTNDTFMTLWKNWTIEADNLPVRLSHAPTNCEIANQNVRTCPSSISVGPILTPSRERSVCPWYYVKDVNELRLPRVIMRAKCKCKKCFANSHNVTGVAADYEFNCLEMYVDIPVMYCSENKIRCVATITKVAVSCACVYRPKY